MPSAARHVVVGLGRWGGWLAYRLDDCGLGPERVVARGKAVAAEVGGYYDCAHSTDLTLRAAGLTSDHVVWVCLPDDALAGWVARFAEAHPHSTGPEPLVVIASGGTPLSPLSAVYARVGAAWPVQSITAEREPDWSTLPFVVQTARAGDEERLRDLCRRLGGGRADVVAGDGRRLTAHLGAVLVQNFVNLLWREAADLLATADLDYRVLLPLAEAHLGALAEHPPGEQQTGPAARGDLSTQASHLALLDRLGSSELAALYRDLSGRIARLEASGGR